MSLFKPIEDPHDKEGFIYNFQPDIEIPSSSDDEENGRDEWDKTKWTIYMNYHSEQLKQVFSVA